MVTSRGSSRFVTLVRFIWISWFWFKFAPVWRLRGRGLGQGSRGEAHVCWQPQVSSCFLSWPNKFPSGCKGIVHIHRQAADTIYYNYFKVSCYKKIWWFLEHRTYTVRLNMTGDAGPDEGHPVRVPEPRWHWGPGSGERVFGYPWQVAAPQTHGTPIPGRVSTVNISTKHESFITIEFALIMSVDVKN